MSFDVYEVKIICKYELDLIEFLGRLVLDATHIKVLHFIP